MAPRPVHALIAATALAGVPLLTMPLVLAQETGASLPEEPVAVPALPPAPAPLPAAEAPPAEPPLRPAATPAVPAWQAEPEHRRAEPPRRFDHQINALERDRIVTPNERVRVRGTIADPSRPAVQIACRDGALSARECGGGPTVVGRSRRDGEVFGPLGSGASPAGAGPNRLNYGGPGEGFSTAAAPLPPISVPVTALLSGSGGNFRLTDVFGRTPRPAAVAGNGNLRLLYPLIGSAVTSSEFGWRIHPVLGSWLMHAGKDLAAPEGTPVVASLSGRVVMSGLAGGYGLAVEIEHDSPRRRTLYGHLSELYVKEGQRVKQGEVIGRVGSTGLSTGPHLHFELRVPQDGGWVAVDPGDLDPGNGLSGTAVAGAGPNGLGALSGPGNGAPSDAVALLLGQLIQTLERPRSPLPLPGERLPAPAQLPAPAPLAAPASAPQG